MFLLQVLFCLCCTQSIFGFDLTLLHTNDIHARIEQISKYGSSCSGDDAAENKCYGGAARLFTKLEEIRSEKDNVLYMNAGDSFQGTLWYFYYKGLATAHFGNKMGIDAATLGNHEFDDGPEVLATYLQNITFPMLACNLDATNEPQLQGLYQSSLVINVSGTKIGVIGYITEETKILVSPDYTKNLNFTDPIQCVREEVQSFKAEGIDIIIAVGHAGFKQDVTIAEEVDGLDIIVGGHSNTFLYTGDPPSNESPVGPYPYVVQQASGRNVLIVQAYAFGKYLGYLDVKFDEDGEVDFYGGNPILLDGSVQQDPDVLADVQEWAQPIQNLQNEVVGETYVLLEGNRAVCRMYECNLGNFVTDAALYLHQTGPENVGGPWTQTAIALWNSGGIRASFLQGPITVGHVLSVMPFRNEIVEVRLQGKYLLQMLEHSVSEYDITGSDLPGRFLQMSGMKVTYDVSRPIGSRVLKVYTKCADCLYPKYEPLEVDKVYGVITSAFLYAGGDGYDMIAANALSYIPYGTIAGDALREYVRQFSPVVYGEEGRITVEDSFSINPPYPSHAIQIAPFSMILNAVILLILRFF